MRRRSDSQGTAVVGRDQRALIKCSHESHRKSSLSVFQAGSTKSACNSINPLQLPTNPSVSGLSCYKLRVFRSSASKQHQGMGVRVDKEEEGPI